MRDLALTVLVPLLNYPSEFFGENLEFLDNERSFFNCFGPGSGTGLTDPRKAA